eukprot:PhF_6_TR25395/c0_g1_i1/m.35113/K14709/SLC39A1_2_3, ZIP1_2_3; solute carrier family 39 (zinc transporter), member 1/2/3
MLEESTDLFGLQIFTVAILFIVSLIGASAPLWLKAALKGDAFEMTLSLVNTWTVGLFLATGLGHMLVHCATGLQEAGWGAEWSLQVATMACLSGFLLTLVVEKVLLGGCEHDHGHGGFSTAPMSDFSDHNHHHLNHSAALSNVPIFLAIVLAVHGVLEGMAMGVERSPSSLRVVLIGMIPHKFFTGLAMGSSLHQHWIVVGSSGGGGRWVLRKAVKVGVSWACATPGGILLGMVLVGGLR